jgi:hypothetical protein
MWLCLLLRVATPAADASSGNAATVYWTSSPTHGNETLMVAGAGLDGVVTQLCSDRDCANIIHAPPATTWKQSIQLVLPPTISPPAYLKIAPSNSTVSTAATIVEINRPDVWWATSNSPARMPNTSLQVDPKHPSWINCTVQSGDAVRVFGRSLAWTAGNVCVGGVSKPVPVASTTLSLTLVAGTTKTTTSDDPDQNQLNNNLVIEAIAANCFEATFPTSIFPPGNYMATLSTPWASSAAFGLTVVTAVGGSGGGGDGGGGVASVTIDVTKDFGGDISKALAHAAALPISTRKVVELGPHTCVDAMHLKFRGDG